MFENTLLSFKKGQIMRDDDVVHGVGSFRQKFGTDNRQQDSTLDGLDWTLLNVRLLRAG
jgi:hypothetical protein